ncbi:TIGR03619 family F420-dependent LLM class oxidoreductase [Lentzea sp. BCCO 10_0856]|uniref:TIGR03619 family F420-dependent LLM class oxidoreductase n=1 Tax=Lentzea miocenica TaxID=3095431 RepID=A0ABU4TBD2_9PSEU|nr:TIGR03619 family F420-dependent LLM class oxidoreductase [Lentzea sp. BCCO 10_0856]MDX8035476.1 TIGR03619 family F420-dependent LLM class oxidoreductase [Lentzea sp. BCCO 10_0856]
MRIGLALPQYGEFADTATSLKVAVEAERLGYDSLWVSDRMLLPTHPRDRYPSHDGVVPPEYTRFLDPLVVLTAAATVTSKARLGTSTLNALWHPPALLARTLTTIDQLSGGRLDVGIGLGWSRDEYEAAGVPWGGRGARLDETLDVLKAVWTGDPVAHNGKLWTVPESVVDVKPVQRPHPPVLLAAFTPRGLARIARKADGWLGVGLPLPLLTQTVNALKQMAGDRALRMPTRVNPVLTDEPVDPRQVPIRGTVGQIADYLVRAGEVVDEVLIDLQLTATSEQHLVDLAGEFAGRLR